MTTLCVYGLTLAAQPKVAGGGSPLGPMDWLFVIALGVFLGSMLLGAAFAFLSLFRAWAQAALSGAPVMFFDILAMRLRRSPIQKLVEARVRSRKAGLEIGLDMWEAHHLARGNVEKVLEALIRAYQGQLTIDYFTDRSPPEGKPKEWIVFNTLASHCLAGGDPVAVVEAMIALRAKNMAITFMEAATLDLAQRTSEGRRMVEAVAEAVEMRRLLSNNNAPQAQGEGNA